MDSLNKKEQQVRRMKSTAAVGGPSFRSALATKAATLWEARANPLLKFRLTADLDLFSAHQFMFSTDSVIEELDPTELDSMQDILMSAFLDLAKSSNEASATVPQSNSTTAAPSTSKDSTPTLDSEPTDMGITTNKWKLFKKKPGVEMFKQSIAIEEKTTELVKSVIDIDCDVHRVFSVRDYSTCFTVT